MYHMQTGTGANKYWYQEQTTLKHISMKMDVGVMNEHTLQPYINENRCNKAQNTIEELIMHLWILKRCN